MSFCALCLILIPATILLYFVYSLIKSKIKLSNLHDKSVIVTGCDTGFGHWIALKLAENKITVFAGCLTENSIKILKTKAKENAQFLNAFRLDVTSQKSVDEALKFVSESTDKKLWGLLNNAGIGGKSVPDDFLTENDYRSVLEVNFYGIIKMCHAFKPLLKKSKGRIINTASLAGRLAMPGMAPYFVSKHMVEIYSDILRYELRPFGVTVHVIEPNAFKTPIAEGLGMGSKIDKEWAAGSQEIRDEYGQDYLQGWKDVLHQIFYEEAEEDYMKVVDAYFHALTAKYPQERYWVGIQAHFILPLSSLPLWIQDLKPKPGTELVPQICK